MKIWKTGIVVMAVVALAGAGYYFHEDILGLFGIQSDTANTRGPGAGFDPTNMPTTVIRPAADSAQVSAAGNIALVSQQQVAMEVAGVVAEVTVAVGDPVKVDDLLVVVDTTDLERSVTQAKLDLETSQIQMDSLLEPVSESELASAKSELASAKETLAEVQAGASDAELAAAEANLASAQANYQELLDGPSEAELTQLSASLQKATITLQDAQRAYDKVAYADDVGHSSQASELQQATIDYESAKAAYVEATEAASESDLQDAQAAIQSAQEALDDLRAKPTAAELAQAEATVAKAQASLDTLLEGASQTDLREAEIKVEQAKINLESALSDLAKARLYSPIDGTTLAVNVEVGQRVTSDAATNAVTVADLTDLELAVNVAEVDIPKVCVGQTAKITVDALPDQSFNGEVTHIAPTSEESASVVNYPVTIKLIDPDLTGVRPGMTAVADLLAETVANSWLVPTNSVQDRGNGPTVMVVSDERPTPVSVTTLGTQGEWTIVQSDELREGDHVIGTVTSFVNEEGQSNRMRQFGPMGGGLPPD